MAKWFKSEGLVTLEIADRIARITLNAPEKRNALCPNMLAELDGALMEADDRLDVSVIILQGAGKDFCAGYDLTGVYAGRAAEAFDNSNYRKTTRSIDDDVWSVERNYDWLKTISKIHKPVIAKVQGNCLAGGTDLAFYCDMVVASETARIGFPATRANGSPPAHMWTYLCGPQWAKRLLLTGDSVTGKDAAKIGLVLEAVPAEELDAAVNELARRITHVDADLLSCHKRIVNIALELMGAETVQRLATEMDARAHKSEGPLRTKFKADFAEGGMKQALKGRDEPFGDGYVKVRDYN
jgi:enoyl-CoA hydratase